MLSFGTRHAARIILIAFCTAIFVDTLSFGTSLSPRSIDSTWSAVLGWAFLHQAQWGIDIVFTYGPLGFMHSGAAFVPGIFPWYLAGQLFLSAAFAILVCALLWRAAVVDQALFGLVFLCWSSRISGDVASLLTLLFGAACAMRYAGESRHVRFALVIVGLAPVFAVLALTKFSLFPAWLVCVTTLAFVCAFRKERMRLLPWLIFLPIAVAAIWVFAAQGVSNIPSFLKLSAEIASGYGHAMGQPAPSAMQFAGIASLLMLAALCLFSIRRHHTFPSAAFVALAFGIAVLAWFAAFTRGDTSHWPYFFPTIALIPFSFLIHRQSIPAWMIRTTVVGALAAGWIGLSSEYPGGYAIPPREILGTADQIGENLYSLFHLRQLQESRRRDWIRSAEDYDLPRIRERVASSKLDMLGAAQGVVLLNGFNYAPRPIFQSYSAYTSLLARVNEDFFLGPSAPRYVLLPFDPIDNRSPMSEDGLAQLALLRRYHPVVKEKQLLLLELDSSLPPVSRIVSETTGTRALLGEFVSLPPTAEGSVAFVDVGLSTLGKVYTALYREPELRIAFRNKNGVLKQYRLVRESASAGFLASPLLLSADDWLNLYSGNEDALDVVDAIKVDASSPWARFIFDQTIKISLEPAKVLHASSTLAEADLHRNVSVCAQECPSRNAAKD